MTQFYWTSEFICINKYFYSFYCSRQVVACYLLLPFTSLHWRVVVYLHLRKSKTRPPLVLKLPPSTGLPGETNGAHLIFSLCGCEYGCFLFFVYVYSLVFVYPFLLFSVGDARDGQQRTHRKMEKTPRE